MTSFSDSAHNEVVEILEFRYGEGLYFYTDWQQAYDLRRCGYLYALRRLNQELTLPGEGTYTDNTLICLRQVSSLQDEIVWQRVSIPPRTEDILVHAVPGLRQSFSDQWLYLLVRRIESIDPIYQSLNFKAKGIPYPHPFWLKIKRLTSNDEYYSCSVDLGTCPLSFYEAIVNCPNFEVGEALEKMGFINVPDYSVIYQQPNSQQ